MYNNRIFYINLQVFVVFKYKAVTIIIIVGTIVGVLLFIAIPMILILLSKFGILRRFR